MSRQFKQLMQARADLEQHQSQLQQIVHDRTAELEQANDLLRREIAQRHAIDDQFHKLSMAVAQSPSIVMITDRDGLIEYVNPEFKRVTGFHNKGIIGKNAGDLGHANPEYQMTELWKTIKAGRSWSGEFHNRKADGTTYWERAIISPIRDKQDGIIGYLKTALDETRAKEAQEHLENNYRIQTTLNHILKISLQDGPLEARLREILECILILPFLSLLQKGAIFVTGQDRETLNMAVQIGLSGDAALRCEHISLGHCLCGRAAREKKLLHSGHAHAEHNEPADPHMHYCVPCVHENHALGVLCLYLAPGHERNTMEEQFLQAAADVIAGMIRQSLSDQEKESLRNQYYHSQKMEAIGVLAGGVAHDFNNMLAGIQGNAELATRRNAMDVSARDCLKQIIKITGRAADLTRQLLLFSRKQPMVRETVDLGEAVASISKMLGRLIGNNINLTIRCEKNTPCILADKGSLDQILMNLVVNARDAMPHGGEIRVSLGPLDINGETRGARLSVSDTGEGMDQETRQHIFEPFYTTKEQGKGTGLGLSVVYGIMQQINGDIQVQSQPGAGTTFILDFPASEDASAPADRPANSLPPQGRSERVLFVEDNEFVASVGCAILESAGYCVQTALTAAHALSLLGDENNRFDIVVSDIQLPDGNGMSIVDRASGGDPPTPCMLISGHIGEQAVWDTIRDREYVFLQKPFSMTDFLSSVRTVLDAPAPGR